MGRRGFGRLALGAAGIAAVGCGGRGSAAGAGAPEVAQAATILPNVAADGAPATATATASPAATATPVPVPARGETSRLLLAGTPQETPLVIRHSGLAGPALLVLGGVHGNEPGGWMAAEQVAAWPVTAGSLLVVPRANNIAIQGFVRTTDALGDLNRLYPGDPASALPMERMAAEIVAAAGEFAVAVVLDMHESWAFYSGRSQNGTAYLGQTVTAGVGPRNATIGAGIVERVNAGIQVDRDRLVLRDGTAFRRPDATSNSEALPQQGRSSLALGGWVAGLTPVLVEMGQENQPIERRTELHLAVARATFALLGLA